MMYFITDRVRYSETDINLKLTAEAVLNYFQDCSTFHSEDKGLGIDTLKEQGLVWVLNFWQIIFNRLPIFGEKIRVGTAPYDFKGCMGLRNFLLETLDGQKLACANSVWALLDQNGRPVKVSKEMADAYGIEQKLEMEYVSRKITYPSMEEKGWVKADDITIKTHHLDTNCHVNNGQYVRMALDLIPADSSIKEIRAEYRKSAVLDDIVKPMIYRKDNIYTILLGDKEFKAYAVVQLITAD